MLNLGLARADREILHVGDWEQLADGKQRLLAAAVGLKPGQLDIQPHLGKPHTRGSDDPEETSVHRNKRGRSGDLIAYGDTEGGRRVAVVFTY